MNTSASRPIVNNDDPSERRSARREQRAEDAHADRSHGRSLSILFRVPFKSAMTDTEVARLRGELELVTYTTRKTGVSGASPGVVPLDLWSGLFLERGDGENEWVLEGRTWGNPPDSLIHEWHVRAALAALELDPTVEIPAAAHAASPANRTPPLSAENKRHARLGRRPLHIE